VFVQERACSAISTVRIRSIHIDFNSVAGTEHHGAMDVGGSSTQQGSGKGIDFAA
jgi:hypothetical protein